jgi:hypothetical protein
MEDERMNEINEPEVKDRTAHYLALLLGVLIVAFAIIFILQSAIENGTLGWLAAGIVLLILLSVFVVERMALVYHRLVEAHSMRRATKIEKLSNGVTTMWFDSIPMIAAPVVPLQQRDDGFKASRGQISEALADSRRGVGLTLLAATIKHPDYGPNSIKLLTQADAQKTGLFGGTLHDDAVKYLCKYYSVHAEAGRGQMNGTYTKDGKTVSDVLLDTAIHDLPPAQIGAAKNR